MITHEEIRELAQFKIDQGYAITFYFEPHTPPNKSHREEAILAKELVRNALRESEKNGKHSSLRSDLNRILILAESLHGNQARAKAVFACGQRNFWREFDLPPQFAATQLFVNRQFYLKPLAQFLGAQPRLWAAIVDRQRARFFDLRLDELQEREGLFRTPPVRQGRSDGFAGYDGGHTQRRIEDEARHHFKAVAEHLKDGLERGCFENLIIGCHDTNWHEFEMQLHPYVRKRVLGRFSTEVAKLTNDQIREQATRIVHESLARHRHELVREVLNQAKGNGLGVTGLRRVLRSLELGEVQTLLMGDNFRHAAVECTGCRHLDAHLVRYCPACGRETRDLEDVADAIIPLALCHGLELLYVKDDEEFDKAGNIAALLRFRTDHRKGRIDRVAS